MSGGPSSLAAMLMAQTRLELTLAARRGESVLVTVVIPAALLLFLGSVPVLPAVGADRVASFLPGLVALAIMSASMVSLGIATAFERHYRVLKRLGASPLPRWGLIVAKMLSVLAIEAVQVALLLGLALVVFGSRPNIHLPLLLLAVALGTAAFAGLGLLMAGALRAELVLALANGLYVVLLLAGGLVVPLDLLPRSAAAVAGLTPAASLAAVLRATLAGGAGLSTGDLAVLAVWAVGAPLAAARAFRWE